jgi:ABC-type Fe3+-siderophore transport system permease subunit
MNSLLESVELMDYGARLLLGIGGALLGFVGIALPNIVRGVAPSESYAILDPVMGMLGQSFVMLSQAMGQSVASIPVSNF